MDDMKEMFEKVFSVLKKDSFFEKPEAIFSYMRDVGFKKSIINMISSIINLDRRRFYLSLTCPDEDVERQARVIAEDCMFNESMLMEVVLALREAIDDRPKTKLIDHPKYGRCRSTIDDIAIYSEDLTRIIRVFDASEFTIPSCVTIIDEEAFASCQITKITIPNTVICI